MSLPIVGTFWYLESPDNSQEKICCNVVGENKGNKHVVPQKKYFWLNVIKNQVLGGVICIP